MARVTKSGNSKSNGSALGFKASRWTANGQRADHVAQASPPAGFRTVPVREFGAHDALAAGSGGGTPAELAAGTSALREEFTRPNVAEIIGISGGADQLRNDMLYRQTTFRNHLCRTRDLLLPRPLSGHVAL